MKLFTSKITFQELRARRKTYNELLRMSERMLIDCNISPALLEQGIKGWPWRELPDQVVVVAAETAPSMEPLASENTVRETNAKPAKVAEKEFVFDTDRDAQRNAA